MDIAQLEKFLQDRVKLDGKSGVLGDSAMITKDNIKIFVSTDVPLSKWYLKYLTTKYLQKHKVCGWLAGVIPSKKDKRVCELKYFNVADNEGN